MNTADILDKAADLIAERGWHQGYYVNDCGGLCVSGAVYVALGAMAGRVAGREGVTPEIPPDKEVVFEVTSGCLSMSDLYPTFARIERIAVKRGRAEQ